MSGCFNKSVCYIGDGNNVSRSLGIVCEKLGIKFITSSPEKYALPEFKNESNIEKAVQNADVIYTDVWTSMGNETTADQRKKDFSSYRVTNEILKKAHPNAIFLHCLPANRNEEVAASVIDGPQSVVFDQAENRLHAQKALLAELLVK